VIGPHTNQAAELRQRWETRGRKPKIHKPINTSFDEVLGALGESKYQDKKTLKRKKK
jgi:hypothetical protein